MQIVIDIDEEIYERCREYKLHCGEAVSIEGAVANGTPLPKGHGRLIDSDELKKIIKENDILTMTGFSVRLCDIDNTPTIIEADKKSEEE